MSGEAFSEAPYGELVDSTLRLMTWNVWGRFGPWSERAAGIVDTIRGVSPEGAELDLHHDFAGGDDLLFGTWGLGNGILSRWPIADHQLYELPALDANGWGGIATRALIDGPRGPISTYNVALDWPPYASAARKHALRHLAEIVADNLAAVKGPVIIAGDFNAGPESDEIRMRIGRTDAALPGFVLFDAWDHAPVDQAGITWSRSNPWAAPNLLPDQRIGYIFSGWPRRGGVGSVTDVAIAGHNSSGITPSDHYAVVADVRY